MITQTEYIGEHLPACDVCGKYATHDAKTTSGPWAYLCDDHFEAIGIGLGTGKGQKLILVNPEIEKK